MRVGAIIKRRAGGSYLIVMPYDQCISYFGGVAARSVASANRSRAERRKALRTARCASFWVRTKSTSCSTDDRHPARSLRIASNRKRRLNEE